MLEHDEEVAAAAPIATDGAENLGAYGAFLSRSARPTRRNAEVVVIIIPIIGSYGAVQSRTVVTSAPPTKASLLAELQVMHDDSSRRTSYDGAWAKCISIVQTLPEEKFEALRHRQQFSIWHYVDLEVSGETVRRMFTARVCRVRETAVNTEQSN